MVHELGTYTMEMKPEILFDLAYSATILGPLLHLGGFVFFDIFHSIGRIDSITPRRTDVEVFSAFLEQALLAEDLGFDTMWVAESHFSSEVQKRHRQPVIPNYHGEVGLNADAMVLAQTLFERTKKLNFGTAIFNIVGGNGGPIAAADRVNFLTYMNQFRESPRKLQIGVAAGRFPYINSPFGIVPRSREEECLWGVYKRFIFLEALEIFLRLLQGEVICSDDIESREISAANCGEDAWEKALAALGKGSACASLSYVKRWQFEPIALVPRVSEELRSHLSMILGSHDPEARHVGFRWADLDLFNLSFTPPAQLAAVHQEMFSFCEQHGRRPWHRARMPRTVLVFVDEDSQEAARRADQCFDTYIEAMRGTVVLPPKQALLERALVGSPEMICEQLHPDNSRGFHADDRLMLWFEFNQADYAAIRRQMTLFSEKVRPHFVT